jgi:ATP-dependent Clp protease ATP-binding subunit ClpC
MGPTGVGKTETVNVLSETLFYGQPPVRENCGEFTERHTVSVLKGSPPGYIGSNHGSRLIEKLKRRPFSVLLFDEIEKAHHDVHNLILQFLDEGVITGADGTQIDIRESYIFMTSNLGARYLDDFRKPGFINDESNQKKQQEDESQKFRMQALRKFFSPEFLGRIDHIICFKPLSHESLKEICILKLKEFSLRTGFEVIPEEEIIEKMILERLNPDFGAREIDRIMDAMISPRIAEAFIKGKIKKGDRIRFGYCSDGNIFLEYGKTVPAVADVCADSKL